MNPTRKIVKIDEEKCDGCGQCVTACAEGALQIIDGKARLVSEIYCDGLGACLGTCPQDAITVEEREAEGFDEKAVEEHLAAEQAEHQGCPGSAVRSLAPSRPLADAPEDAPPSRLGHWPVQLMLVPPGAPFLRGADIVVCADCVAYAVPDFHRRYLDGRAILVGCPKLDDLAFYREKLKKIFAEARPASITVLRMEVPCCAGIAAAALEARAEAAPDVPAEVHTIGIHGDITREVVGAPAAGEGGHD